MIEVLALPREELKEKLAKDKGLRREVVNYLEDELKGFEPPDQGGKDRVNTIQLGIYEPPKVDWRTAMKVIEMLPGNVAVEMEPGYEGAGKAIVVPPKVAGRLRPDTATVLAVGAGVDQIAPGERVCVLPYDGKHFTIFEHSAYRSAGRVRMIGVSTQNEHERSRVFYGDVIVAKIKDVKCRLCKGCGGDCARCQGKGTYPSVLPILHWVLIRRFPIHQAVAGIELPDEKKYREHKAEVIVAGASCETVRAGDTVVYQAGALVLDFEFGDRFGMEGDPRDYCLIHEDDLHCVLRGVENAA